jgi:TonB-dependent Receptor Plug Domain
MKKQITLSIVFLLVIFSAFTRLSDIDLSEKIISKLNQYMLKKPQEKVYLHFDKPYYMAGETIWFKGYLFDATLNNIDSISRILYVDLIDPSEGKIVMHSTLKCEKGMTNGSFLLPENLDEKLYTIRAYTNYMKNFSEDWFFEKSLKIWQGSIKERTEYEQLTTVSDCSFFPEGGDMVANLECRVAFKAVNAIGKGIDIQGVLLENDVDTITYFKSFYNGMGYFSFTPKLNAKYTAIIKQRSLKQEEEKIFPKEANRYILPKVKEKGFKLFVDNLTNKNNIRVFIHNSHPTAKDKSSELIVIAHQRGIPCFKFKGSDSNENIGMNIPRNIIPDDGIVQITLFDSKGKPHCERLIFVYSNKQINLKIKPDKSEYQTREKVTLQIEATDSVGKPIEGNFSLAATDGSQVLSNRFDENLITYLLLSSDLNGANATIKGNIEDPAYYLDKTNKAAIRDLDVLMMTQGWRRFTWDDVLSDSAFTPKFSIEQGLSITGKAIRPNGKISTQPISVTLFLKEDGKSNFSVLTTDSLGQFGLYMLDFKDSTTVFIKAVKDKGLGGLKLLLDKNETPQVKIQKISPNALVYNAESFANFLKTTQETVEFELSLRRSQEKLLKTVEVTAKKKEKIDDRRIYNKPINSIDMTQENCASYNNILDFLNGRVAGIQVSQQGFERSVRIRGSGNVNFRLDGMSIGADFINSLSPCDVETIDILKGAEAAIFGSQGGAGVISILTKRGNPNYDYSKDKSENPANVIVQKITGYTPTREFYAPKYDIAKPEHEFKDFRATLHWQPNITTDKQGKATVTFWNSDAKTKVNVIIEGVSKKGQIGVASCTYNIMK